MNHPLPEIFSSFNFCDLMHSWFSFCHSSYTAQFLRWSLSFDLISEVENWFSLHKLSLDISHYHLIKHYVYADDFQVYLSNLGVSFEIQSYPSSCPFDISTRMVRHLTLNMLVNLEFLLKNPFHPKSITC